MSADKQRQKLISAELKRVDGSAPETQPVLDKHVKMAGSPFQFLRGSAQIFYADLAGGGLKLPERLLQAPLTRVVGDCHLANFGFFTEEGSYGDTVIWAPNDYDDAAEGHAAFDLTRFCVSLFLVVDYLEGLGAGRYQSNHSYKVRKPLKQKDAVRAAEGFLKSYRKTLKKIVGDPEKRNDAVKRFDKDHFLREPLEKARSRAPGGRHFEKKSSLAKLATRTKAGFRFNPDTDKLVPVDLALAGELEDVFRPHLDDTVLDVARRIGAGTGSLSVDRYYFLVGPDGATDAEAFRETHVVEVKQQREAALIHHFPGLSPVNRMTSAHLTVDCQRRMMRRPDLVLEDVVWNGAHWLVRSRHHARLTIDPEDLLEANKPEKALRDYVKACGVALARTHSRGDRRSVRFERVMAAALADKAEDLVAVARAYAGRVISDHSYLTEMLGNNGDEHAA